jgi:hypothetical protein
MILDFRGEPKGGGRMAGAAKLQPPLDLPKTKFKITDFIGMMIPKFLHDLPFSQNQPLTSADNLYIRVLRNKLNRIKKKTRR